MKKKKQHAVPGDENTRARTHTHDILLRAQAASVASNQETATPFPNKTRCLLRQDIRPTCCQISACLSSFLIIGRSSSLPPPPPSPRPLPSPYRSRTEQSTVFLSKHRAPGAPDPSQQTVEMKRLHCAHRVPRNCWLRLIPDARHRDSKDRRETATESRDVCLSSDKSCSSRAISSRGGVRRAKVRERDKWGGRNRKGERVKK